jgi:hypothetical protein
MKLSKLIFESFNNSSIIMSVDIQPEAMPYLNFNLREWAKVINNASSKIVFLYNGYNSIGQIKEKDYKFWLIEEAGITEDIIYNSLFFDKGYGFYRSCIDNNIDDEKIIKLLKYMMENEIYDSRDIEDEEIIDEEILEYIKHDPIYLPLELIEFIKENINGNVILMGGGLNECLREVEISLLFLNKKYKIDNRFIY